VANIAEDDIPLMQVGQPVKATVRAYAGRIQPGVAACGVNIEVMGDGPVLLFDERFFHPSTLPEKNRVGRRRLVQRLSI
jgi:hypothetical protein